MSVQQQSRPVALTQHFSVTRPWGQVMVTHIDAASGMGIKPSKGYINLTPKEIGEAKAHGVPALAR